MEMIYYLHSFSHAYCNWKTTKWSSRMSQYQSIGSLSCFLLFQLIYCFILQESQGLRIIGNWSSRNSQFSILAKFGFQQIDPLDAEHSRGFVYGNISSEVVNGGNFVFRFHSTLSFMISLRYWFNCLNFAITVRGVLLILPRTLISAFIGKTALQQSCELLLQVFQKCLVKNFVAHSLFEVTERTDQILMFVLDFTFLIVCVHPQL